MNVAKHKHGAPVILLNLDQYSFEVKESNKTSGIVVCRIGPRDENKRKRTDQIMAQHGIKALPDGLPESSLKFTVTPWIAQEIGFLHSGEAENTMRNFEFSSLQFETSVISHFRELSQEGLKVFVSAVLGSRVLRCGAPVFSRDGTLLGILSDTESCKSDAGRRAVVRSLLGHPLFTRSASKK